MQLLALRSVPRYIVPGLLGCRICRFCVYSGNNYSSPRFRTRRFRRSTIRRGTTKRLIPAVRVEEYRGCFYRDAPGRGRSWGSDESCRRRISDCHVKFAWAEPIFNGVRFFLRRTNAAQRLGRKHPARAQVHLLHTITEGPGRRRPWGFSGVFMSFP